MKQIVNCKPLKGEIIEGQEYYYKVGGVIKEATAVKCEKCSKWCTVNSVTITSFNRPETNIEIAPLDDDELSYDEETYMSVCEGCL